MTTPPADRPSVPFPDSYWVVSSRLLAGEYPADADPKATSARLLALLESGIRTFIDLTEEAEVRGLGIGGYAEVLKDVAHTGSYEVTYLRVPIPDRRVPSVWTLRRILDVIDHSLADENPVYVHCWAGRGRTGTVTGCYLRRHEMVLGSDVVTKLAELRQWMPSGRESSPHTPEQIRMVKNWKDGA